MQASFRNSRSPPLQHALYLHIVQKDCKVTSKTAYVAFLDLCGAFDMLPHSILAKSLHAIERVTTDLALPLIARHDNTLPNGVKVSMGRGVSQVSVLDPLLFDVFIDPLRLPYWTAITQLPPSPSLGGAFSLFFTVDSLTMSSSVKRLDHHLSRAGACSKENLGK